jgi:3-oxoacyl-[acyl-carrier-protein] synthase-3
MHANGLTKGVLVTCDPYSKIIDPDDKGTALLFGDAAAATLLSDDPLYVCSNYCFGTQGDDSGVLATRDGTLHMNGREVFNFAAKAIPAGIGELLSKSNLNIDDIDCYVFHQGSKYIVDTLVKRLGVSPDKVPFDIENLGNTVSSSIPIILKQQMAGALGGRLILCGFGVGLSWAVCLCEKVK